MFRAMIFFPDGWCKSQSDISLETALKNLQKKFPERKLKLTYRPMDGTIYNDNYIPCGVVFEVRSLVGKQLAATCNHCKHQITLTSSGNCFSCNRPVISL